MNWRPNRQPLQRGMRSSDHRRFGATPRLVGLGQMQALEGRRPRVKNTPIKKMAGYRNTDKVFSACFRAWSSWSVEGAD